MAKEAALTYVPGVDEEAQKANKAYADALATLTSALDARKNRMFDPYMLAMAEGFLTPAKTGHAFEAMGTVAQRLRGVQEAQGKEDIDIAEKRLGLAERGIALEQQKQRARLAAPFLASLSGAPAPAPGGAISTGEAAPGAAPAVDQTVVRALDPNAPPPQVAGTGVRGRQIAPPNPTLATERQYLAFALSEGKSLADTLEKARAFAKDRYQVKENGVFDVLTGMFYEIDTGDTVEIDTPRGRMRIPKDVARKGVDAINQYIAPLMTPAAAAGAEEAAKVGARLPFETKQETRMIPVAGGGFKEVSLSPADAQKFDVIVRQHGVNSPQAQAFSEKFVSEGLPSPSDVAAERAGKETFAKEEAQKESAERQGIAQRASEASMAISRADVFRRYADRPDAAQIFGLFSNNKISSAIVRLMEQGVGVTGPGGRFAVGIPELQDVLRGLNLTDEQRSTYQVAMQMATEMMLRLSQYAKGSVSNFEQGLFREATLNPAADNPRTLRMKADMVRLRAELDKEIAKEFSKSKMKVEDFRNSDWFTNRVAQYEQDLMQVSQGGRLQTPSTVPTWDPATKSWR